MDECFRFLINVNQCLNMSSFDIFFYKLINERKFHLNQVQLLDDPTSYEASFRHAIQDVRMYLNKYPYHFKEYQFIVAMRTAWHQMTMEWESTLLYRLLRFSYELSLENIHMDTGATVDRALNLIMLYDADPGDCMGELDDYLTSERLWQDCLRLFDRMGICGDGALTLDGMERAVEAYLARDSYDPIICSFVQRFIELRRGISFIGDEEIPMEGKDLEVAFADFMKGQFSNYQVMELRIPRDLRYSPRENTLALLRIVEFINRSVAPAPGEKMVSSLKVRCLRSWQAVLKDDNLEQKYSDMLYVYEHRLKYVKSQLETDVAPIVHATGTLPKRSLDDQQKISDPDSVFEKKKKDGKTGKESDLTKMLDDFRHSKLSARSARSAWQGTKHALEDRLDDLEGTLKRYADCLSRQYSKKIETRKKEVLKWKEQIYFADEDTEAQIAELEALRDACLEKLRQPNMTPSLRFEDQANVESALMQANAAIDHDTACLEAATAINFVTVFSVILVGTVLHYTVLQPFVFRDVTSLLVYIISIAATAVGLSLFWYLPHRRFCRAIKKQVGTLKDDMKRYLPGYDLRAEMFCEYINTLDQLDSINKYLALYREAVETSRRLQQGCLWHRTQIKDHLHKLGSFRGLIDSGSGRTRTKTFDPNKCSTAELLEQNGKVNSVEKCSLYWPQGRGDTV